MNFDDILGKLMPLFEQKMAFSMEMSKRAMSLEEKKEASKTDIEYRKLEAQITNDKDKLKWEKEKLTTAVKADYDLQALKNSGMLDSERLKQIGEKEKQKIMEEGANSRAKLNADAETNKAYLTTLGAILGHAQEISQTGLDGQTKTSKPTSEVGTAARTLMEKTGLARPAATPPGRNVAGEAEFAAGVLRNHEKAGTADQARNYLNSLPADTRQAALALLNPGGAATPAEGITPSVPAPAERKPIHAVQPTDPAVEPVRPIVQPADAASPPAIGNARPALQGTRPAPYTPPAYTGSYGTVAPETAAPATPAPATPTFRETYAEKGRQYIQEAKKKKDEEEKNRALRRARGLTVGGF